MKQGKTWRDQFRPRIAEMLDQGRAQGLEGEALRKFAYQTKPFSWNPDGPYVERIWRDEIRVQLKLKRKPGHDAPLTLFSEDVEL